MSLFAWHAKYLVKFDEFQVSLFGAGAALGDFKCDFSWQVRHLVNLKCDFCGRCCTG